MPCEKCGSVRIISKQRVLCPICDGISVIDKKEALEAKQKELAAHQNGFSECANSTDYNYSFSSSIVNRERAALTCIYNAPKREYAIREWLAYTYLLHNLHYSRNKTKEQNLPKLLDFSKSIIRTKNELLGLQKGLAVVTSDEQRSLVWTELEPLTFVPEVAWGDSTLEPMFGIEDREIHGDIALMQEGMMLPIHIALLSEETSRILRQSFHSRILPFVRDPTQAQTFVRLSGKLSTEGIGQNVARKRAPHDVGMILTDENSIQKIRKRLYLTFSKEDVDWYFAGMLPEEMGGEFDLGRSVIVRDKELGTYCVPLFSLEMLAISTMKWMKDADLGRALNVKGGIVEEYFFRFLHSYNISLKSPKTGRPMLRVRNPNNSALEIADIMGYDGKHVLVLETKFWNAPTLGELEEELGKFDRNLSFIKTNLKEFGFNEKSEVIPIFYTPYAPYPLWHGISIVPSILSLGLKVGMIFGTKKVELYKGSSGLEKLLELIKDPLPYPIDGSELVRDLEFNKYRLHDGLVAEYDEEEITVFIDMPESMYGFFAWFDIDPETFRKLRKDDVLPGDIIRMITVNLSGYWSQTQLLTFKKILQKAEWESDTMKALPYSKMIYLFKGT